MFKKTLIALAKRSSTPPIVLNWLSYTKNKTVYQELVNNENTSEQTLIRIFFKIYEYHSGLEHIVNHKNCKMALVETIITHAPDYKFAGFKSIKNELFAQKLIQNSPKRVYFLANTRSTASIQKLLLEQTNSEDYEEILYDLSYNNLSAPETIQHIFEIKKSALTQKVTDGDASGLNQKILVNLSKHFNVSIDTLTKLLTSVNKEVRNNALNNLIQKGYKFNPDWPIEWVEAHYDASYNPDWDSGNYIYVRT